MDINQENWLSIFDYATHTHKSVSTVRRYIKSKKLKYKIENGKYFICYSKSDKQNAKFKECGSNLENLERLKNLECGSEYEVEAGIEMETENILLRRELKKLKEEINELNMLISLYERVKSKTQYQIT